MPDAILKMDMRYFLAFACCGSHFHGDESGSVDRHHNQFGTRVLVADQQRAAAERRKMKQPPFKLDRDSGTVVLEALREVCSYRSWNLLAAPIRTEHVHAIVERKFHPRR